MKSLVKTISIVIIGFSLMMTPAIMWSFSSYDVDARENEDVEDEEGKDEDEDEERSEESSETETVVTEKITISETVSKEIITTTRKDTDGDGIFDEEDEHPQVNDHFIVRDDDHNGIVDTYEKK